MNLTEPQAGSDVGLSTTKAVPQDDGTYRSPAPRSSSRFGEHDLAENIIHLVLARTPDAPAGTKGISLFLVPKFLVDDDGSLGERNDVRCVSIEHKMGIHASPTCVMSLRRRRRRHRLPGRRGAPGHAGHVHDDERRPTRGRRAGCRARRRRLPEGARLRPGASPGQGDRIRVEGAGTDHRAPRCSPHAAVDEVPDRGDAQPARLQRCLHRPLPCAGGRRGGAAGTRSSSCSRRCPRHGAPTSAWRSPRPRSRSSAAWATSRSPASRSTSATCASPRSTKGTNGIQAMDLVGRKLPLRMGGVVNDHLHAMRQVDGELAAVRGPRHHPRPSGPGHRVARAPRPTGS